MSETPRQTTPPPDRNTKTPKLTAPAGATDCHFHIYGPGSRFPYDPSAPFQVEDSTFEDMRRMHATLGIERGVIVHSMVQGRTYEYLLNALCRDPENLRGVAMPAPDITDRELEILTRAGVVGARFAYRGSPEIDMDMIHRLHGFGWHPQFFFRGEAEALDWHAKMKAVPGNFVIDHMGWQPAEHGVDTDGFRVVLDCLDTGRCWVKLSGPYRFSAAREFPYRDTLVTARALIDHAPERLLWGSDWPHPDHFDPMPNDGDLFDMLSDWAPDETVLRQILVDNPAELFGFASP